MLFDISFNTFKLLNWSTSIQNFLSYLLNTINIDINKCICVDIDIEKMNLLKRIIKYDHKNIIVFNKLKNFKYTQIPLNKNKMSCFRFEITKSKIKVNFFLSNICFPRIIPEFEKLV